MFRMMLLAATSVVMLTTPSILAPSNAWAQNAACSSMGPFAFSNAYSGPVDGIARATRNSVAAISIHANRANCTYRVVCVSIDDSKPAFENAKLRCKTIREVLVANLGSGKRTAVKASIELIAKRPRDGYSPASVHVTVVERT